MSGTAANVESLSQDANAPPIARMLDGLDRRRDAGVKCVVRCHVALAFGEPIPEVQVDAGPMMLSGFWSRYAAVETRQMANGSAWSGRPNHRPRKC
jgi:hypothetical protein